MSGFMLIPMLLLPVLRSRSRQLCPRETAPQWKWLMPPKLVIITRFDPRKR